MLQDIFKNLLSFLACTQRLAKSPYALAIQPYCPKKKLASQDGSSIKGLQNFKNLFK
jgi:hypothetical protein